MTEFGTWTQSRLSSIRRRVVKELGLFVRWGRVFPGYEKEAVGFYDEVVRYFREKLHTGALTSFEPFLFMSGDHDVSYGSSS